MAWLDCPSAGFCAKQASRSSHWPSWDCYSTLATPQTESTLLDRAEEQSPIDFRMAVYHSAWKCRRETHVRLGVTDAPEIARRVEGYSAGCLCMRTTSFLEIFVENAW